MLHEILLELLDLLAEIVDADLFCLQFCRPVAHDRSKLALQMRHVLCKDRFR